MSFQLLLHTNVIQSMIPLSVEQVYGVYIAPPPANDFRAAAASEPKTSSETGNGNSRRKSAPGQCGDRNGGSIKGSSTPVATKTATGIDSRNTRSRRDENDLRFAAANQRASSRHVTRTMSEGRRGRCGRLQSSKNTSQQSETHVNNPRWSDDQAVMRKSLGAAELRVENEIIEAIKREQELRY